MFWSGLRAKTKVFRLILASYLVVLLVPLLLGTVLLRGMVRVVRDEALIAHQSALARARDAADAELRALDAVVIEIARGQKVHALLSVESALQGTGIVKVVDAWQELARYRLPALVQDLYLYCIRSDVILSPSISYVRLKFFDESFFSSGGRTFTRWKDALLERPFERRWFPAETMSFGGRESKVLTHVRSLPLGSSPAARGAVMLFVRQDALVSLLTPDGEEADPQILVVDGDGRVLAGAASSSWARSAVTAVQSTRRESPEPLRTGDRWLFTARSMYNDWSYMLSLPDAVVMARLRRVRDPLLVALALFTLAGIAAASALAKWQTRPIREIVRALGKNLRDSGSREGNEYEQVRAAVLELLDGKRDLALALQRQTPLVRHSFLSRLVKGELADRREIELLAGQAGVDLRGPRYLVLVAIFPVQRELTQGDLAALNVVRAAYSSAAERGLPSRAYVVETGVDELSIIFSLPSSDGDGSEASVRSLARVQALALGLRGPQESAPSGSSPGPVLAVGSVAEDVMGICVSYAHARSAARAVSREGSNGRDVVFYDDLPRDSASYYYPLGIENRIVALARKGDSAAIEDLLNMVYRENFERRRLTPSAVQELTAEMRATVVKAGGDGVGPAQGLGASRQRESRVSIDKLLSSEPRGAFDVFVEAFRSICSGVEDRHRTHSRRLREEVLEHLHSSFTDPNLCLQSIATRFRLSPFYVSQFFKEQVGENFHQYLERLRLEAACQLLRGTGLSIADVALKTGYANLSTFRKAFRRVMATSPREVRQSGVGSEGPTE